MVRDAEILAIKVRDLNSRALDESWQGDFFKALNHAYDGVREADEVLAGISAEPREHEHEASLARNSDSHRSRETEAGLARNTESLQSNQDSHRSRQALQESIAKLHHAKQSAQAVISAVRRMTLRPRNPNLWNAVEVDDFFCAAAGCIPPDPAEARPARLPPPATLNSDASHRAVSPSTGSKTYHSIEGLANHWKTFYAEVEGGDYKLREASDALSAKLAKAHPPSTKPYGAPPDCWSSPRPGQSPFTVRRIELAEGDPQRAWVEQKLAQAGPRGRWKVEGVSRIENLRLWSLYCAQHDIMRASSAGGLSSVGRSSGGPGGDGPLPTWERRLFHGTHPQAVDAIVEEGFDRGHCGRNGTILGFGVYFAVGADYSADPTFAQPGPDGVQHLLVARVLVGRTARGQPGLRRPPTDPDDRACDSVCDDPLRPSMYAVFEDGRAYPELLVRLRTVGPGGT
jgi:poly [ADP-ribose] polymerase 10/14/15